MAKKGTFHNPIAPRERDMFSTFAAPTKEQATTGRFMPPGDNYGVGFRTPVGKEKAAGMKEGPIPQESKCFPSDQAV